ncbi:MULTISPECIES: fluoride efflux transporter CrcB [Paenibacillus]|uniref:fluoride efflux transporter CrcB n=1 Tax=Paenibacillus TaxID=44249 RepID=UPI0022B8BC2C|nr:fluoride efflux transporter CrcB [Paenibacillus caseinilyticus]MCZ8520259.1 fluoride efflux transporter CrcB [Paenibacillus caseinilyticus]
MTVWFVGAGGAAGALARYGLSLLFNPSASGSAVPWGTLLCNLLGCLLLGCLAYAPKLALYPNRKAFLTTGFIGAFTTFSTLSLEMVRLLESSAWLQAGVYAGLSFFGGLACIRLGRGFHRLTAREESAE